MLCLFQHHEFLERQWGDLAGGLVLDLGLEVINPFRNIFEAPKDVENGIIPF